MNQRQMVQRQFGTRVVDLIDQYAEVMYEESCDHAINRMDRRDSQQARCMALRQELVSLKGPVVTHYIHVESQEDRRLLSEQIDDFYDVDKVLERRFTGNLGVLCDSESCELFISVTEEMAPLVLDVLGREYPTVKWVCEPRKLELSAVLPVSNWPEARDWLVLKYK